MHSCDPSAVAEAEKSQLQTYTGQFSKTIPTPPNKMARVVTQHKDLGCNHQNQGVNKVLKPCKRPHSSVAAEGTVGTSVLCSEKLDSACPWEHCAGSPCQPGRAHTCCFLAITDLHCKVATTLEAGGQPLQSCTLNTETGIYCHPSCAPIFHHLGSA